MSRVEIISASAGTGKTTRLARIVAEAIESGGVRPEAVLATTFTNRAAAELMERAREHLLQSDQLVEAQRLEAARIGTVNSVCGRIVQDFAFEHGLSPRIRVLDERQSREVLRQARARVVPRPLVAELADVARRIRGLDWEECVGRLIDLARANDLRADQLSVFAKRSWEGLRTLLDPPAAADETRLDAALDEALAKFLDEVDLDRDTTKLTQEARYDVLGARGRGALDLPWSDWLGLARLKTGKKSDAIAEQVRVAATAHAHHPRLHRDLERATHCVFEAAALTLGAYEEHKRRLGVIDFVDQEAYALEMLRDPAIRERLGEEIDLVLVDEFQDTSPIQLDIFLRLAEIADRSVWVGDPKQAIYGFRGADPALMDAAVTELLGGATPEALDRSWRSRPELVRVTSDLFVQAFGEHGMPESLVRLEPGRDEDVAALGPILARWRLGPEEDANTGRTRQNQATDVRALASGVHQLLGDPECQVRDPVTGEPRRLQPGDVAILCPRNDQCRDLADELSRLGVRAVVARAGLLATFEGRLALAALRLWIDPRDALARAQLARWTENPADGDHWLERLLEAREGGDVPFPDLVPAQAISRTREGRGFTGVLAAFDAALAALDVREHCLALGNASERLANLDALRGLAAAYVDLSRAEGLPCTLPGLVAQLADLAADDADEQSATQRPDAVVVNTWHGAKGLEWPVTVLADLSFPPLPSAMGVHLDSERDHIDLQAPLAGRWVRYWPDPYAPKYTGAPLFDRLADHPAQTVATARAERENLRLLYVGWTRARDRLVLATRPGRLGAGRFVMLRCGGEPLLFEPDESGEATWGTDPLSRAVDLPVRELRPGAEQSRVRELGEGYVPAGAREHAPAWRSPSAMTESGAVSDATGIGEPESIGDRIPLNVQDDEQMRRLGDAVHAFLAADRPQLVAATRLELADGCLHRFEVSSCLASAALIGASDALQTWIHERWGVATWRREWPVLHRLTDGSVVRGTADLVLEVDHPARGLVLLDFKSFPGSREQAVNRARAYAGQLRAYAAALRSATGRDLLGAYISLPVSGLVVPVEV